MKSRTKIDPAGNWTDDRVVTYDLTRDLYWVSRQFVARVSRLVGQLTYCPKIGGYPLSQSQVDWLHDNSYIIA